jgi:acetylornithine deacetylase
VEYPLDPVALTAELVRIPSVNPALVPSAMGEVAIADYCEEWFRHHGLETHRLESEPGRPSVVGVAKGTGGDSSLTLNGHFDTVTLAGYDGDPLDPRIEGGKLHGRGSFDMKGGLAAAMVTAARAATLGLRGDVIVACVADEEHASRGTEEVLRHFTADLGIVTEPSHLEITTAHKGFVWLDVTVEGRAAHGSRPELGIDAIALAGHLLVAIGEWQEGLAANPTHPALRSGSVHASLIRGGEEASSYPASCTVTIERRTVPGETADTVEAELRAIVDGIAARVPGFRARIPGPDRARSRAAPVRDRSRSSAGGRAHSARHGGAGTPARDPGRAVLDRLRADAGCGNHRGHVRARWGRRPRRHRVGHHVLADHAHRYPHRHHHGPLPLTSQRLDPFS